EEIMHILRGELPAHFVLQPMKNAEKLRRYLVEKGAKILTDITFCAGKYYHLIAGEGQGGDSYTPLEYAFGRDNLKNPTEAFAGYLQEEITKLAGYSREKMSAETKAAHDERLSLLNEVLHETQRNL
ncbi:MAG: class I SAM-dependent methyltransferase, partial [Clostridia bacterium]|nr:class I SAM-dependent methyltransferase [Clostridia bacterium]